MITNPHLSPPTPSTKPMRSGTITPSTDQYLIQFYQQQPLMEDGPMVPSKERFSDAPIITQLNTPKGNNNNNNYVSKPIRRRSRASKRTPTTLLNANTTNFRALVQQFTGCPSLPMSSLSVHKGPITLNFKNGSSRQKNNNHPNATTQICNTSDLNQGHQVAASASAATAVQIPLPDQQLQPQLQLFQEQHGGDYSFDYMKSNNFVPTLGSSNGLVMGNDFSFHDLNSINDTYEE